MSIDDMLGKLLHEFKFRTPEGATPKGYDEFKQALYKDMLELIGEDEMTPALARKLGYKGTPNSLAQFHNINGRDDLRQELRNKLREYYGVGIRLGLLL